MSTSSFSSAWWQNVQAAASNTFATPEGLAGVSANTILNTTGIMIERAAAGTLGGRVFFVARLAETTVVDYVTNGAFKPGASAELAGVVAGLTVGLLAGAILPGVAGAVAAVAI
jgi:hypothetical protein